MFKPAFLFFNTFLLVIITTVKCFSQVPDYSIELSPGYGKVVRNYPGFPDLNTPAFNVGVTISKHRKGSRPWHRYYNFPTIGISTYAGSLGNKSVLGYYAGAMAEISFEKRIGAKWFWIPRLSLGVAWFNKPYDEQSNPENIVIGSHLTFFAGAEALLGRKITNKFDGYAKIAILHASNSHYRLPNVGMNLPLVAVGIRYNIRNNAEPPIDTTGLKTPSAIRFHLRGAFGMNEFGASTGPVNGPKYPVYLGSVYVSKMFSPVNKVTAGVEGWYSKGVYDYIVSQEFYEKDQQKKACSVALVFGHEFLMGHFGLLTTAGIYLYNPFYKDRLKRNDITGFKDQLKSIIPARLGVQYYLKNTNFNLRNNLFAGIYIKTNFGQADFLETGIGYCF